MGFLYLIFYACLRLRFLNVETNPGSRLLVFTVLFHTTTMASETVDSIDWSHPPPGWGAPSIARCK